MHNFIRYFIPHPSVAAYAKLCNKENTLRFRLRTIGRMLKRYLAIDLERLYRAIFWSKARRQQADLAAAAFYESIFPTQSDPSNPSADQ